MKKHKKNNKRFESVEIKKSKNMNEDTKKIISFVIITIIVLIFFVALYLLNGNLVTKDLKEETTTTEQVNFDDSIIPISAVFKQNGEYYVLLYDKDDETDGFLYDGLVSGYSDDKISLYSVNMGLKINSLYYNTKGKANKKASSYDELVITEPTLLKIKNGKIKEYITGSEKISKEL